MPDPTVTPDVQAAAPAAPAGDPGLSTGASDGSSPLESGAATLPEEYQPYKDVVPWAEVPEYLHEEMLKGIKKFHGDMSRGQQEAAQLRQEVTRLEEKARVLDQLGADPRFIDFYNRTYMGVGDQATAQQTPETSGKLKEFLDTDGLSELQEYVNARVKDATGPLLQRIELLSQSAISDRTARETEALRAKIQAQGWPELDQPRMAAMTSLIQSGRATNAEDAYRIACGDDLVTAAVHKAMEDRNNTLRDQAAITFPPGQAPAMPPTSDIFGEGASETQKLVAESRQELRRQGITGF